MEQKLKYLFIAEFADGTIYEQSPADKSKIDPEKRSEYFDVLQEIERGNSVVKFSLVDADNVVSVNLLTGIFNINGLEIMLESEKVPAMPEKFDLVFYRQHTLNFNATYSLKSGQMTDTPEESDHFIEYFIGWKCNVAGKNYEQKLAVA